MKTMNQESIPTPTIIKNAQLEAQRIGCELQDYDEFMKHQERYESFKAGTIAGIGGCIALITGFIFLGVAILLVRCIA